MAEEIHFADAVVVEEPVGVGDDEERRSGFRFIEGGRGRRWGGGGRGVFFVRILGRTRGEGGFEFTGDECGEDLFAGGGDLAGDGVGLGKL